MDFRYACRTCGHRGKTDKGEDACGKFQIKIDLMKDGCSWHINEPVTCATCKRQYDPSEVTVYITDTMECCYVCQNCYSQFHTCGTCEIYPKCGFSEDHTEPQVVTKTVRQGFMTMQTQVKNPTLVHRHCSTCQCSWNADGDCQRENETGAHCPHWQLRKSLLQ